jgi:hypothetical protein
MPNSTNEMSSFKFQIASQEKAESIYISPLALSIKLIRKHSITLPQKSLHSQDFWNPLEFFMDPKVSSKAK